MTALLGFLYLRFHYIEEGKAIAKAELSPIFGDGLMGQAAANLA
jgi:hypothetical protein